MIKYSAIFFLITFLSCKEHKNCQAIFLEDIRASAGNIVHFDSVNTTKKNFVFYYLRSLDSIANKDQQLSDSVLRISIWPATGFMVRQEGYQLTFDKNASYLKHISDVNTNDTIFPFLHPSKTAVEQFVPKQGWTKFVNDLFCNNDLLSLFDKSHHSGGADGDAVVLQINYAGRIFSNEYASTDTSAVAKKVFSIVEFIRNNTQLQK